MYYFFSNLKCFAWLQGYRIISFKINEFEYEDTQTWLIWLFSGDDHVIWMSPVVSSQERTEDFVIEGA